MTTTPTLRSLHDKAFYVYFPNGCRTLEIDPHALSDLLLLLIDRLEPSCPPTTKIRPAPKCDGRLENCKARSMEGYLDGDCADCSAASAAGAGSTGHESTSLPTSTATASAPTTSSAAPAAAPSDPPAVPAWAEEGVRQCGTGVQLRGTSPVPYHLGADALAFAMVQDLNIGLAALRANRDRLQQQCAQHQATIRELDEERNALRAYNNKTLATITELQARLDNYSRAFATITPPGETA